MGAVKVGIQRRPGTPDAELKDCVLVADVLSAPTLATDATVPFSTERSDAGGVTA